MEHGGRGLPGAYNAILSYEAAYARAPGVYHSVYIIGPSLSAFGSEEQRRFFLPKIARGEVEFLLGYSEPGAGSDLAGVETSAVADGDEYVINGQKSFSTHAQRAEYAWMIARTNPDVPRHRGLSLFVVPMTTEGITVRPIPTVGGLGPRRSLLRERAGSQDRARRREGPRLVPPDDGDRLRAQRLPLLRRGASACSTSSWTSAARRAGTARRSRKTRWCGASSRGCGRRSMPGVV